jgi:hypothetical protein
VKDIIVKPLFMDITMPAGLQQTIDIHPGHTAFAYVFEGVAWFDQKMEQPVQSGTLAKLVSGDQVMFCTGDAPARFLLIAGKPLDEPIAWRGPIVMNTKEELYQAFEDYQTGRFIQPMN